MSEELPQFARDLVASPPRRGQGLDLFFFRAARVLHAYRSPEEIVELLRAVTAGEPVRRGEIERAVERSKACAYRPGQPLLYPLQSPWQKFNPEKRHAVILESRAGFVDLWERSPVRLEEAEPCCTEEIIDRLFPGNPLLCCGQSKENFATQTREEWRGKLRNLQLIVPNPMTARSGRTQEGKQSAHTLETTGPRRFLVVEQDDDEDRDAIDDQAAVLLHLARQAPLALAVHSGGKSIHGWFACLNQTEERLRRFMSYAVQLGADHATWTRSQFVRMPDGRRRNGERQSVFYFNPEVVPQ
jgi:hypothetical protein